MVQLGFVRPTGIQEDIVSTVVHGYDSIMQNNSKQGGRESIAEPSYSIPRTGRKKRKKREKKETRAETKNRVREMVPDAGKGTTVL